MKSKIDDRDGNSGHTISLAQIQEAHARIAPYIRNTPFIPCDYLQRKLKKEVWVKCEMTQKTGSFKIRGAANCVLQNLAQAKKQGVVAASAGNHAQGVAAICSSLGLRSTIVMPVTTPALKIQNTQVWGAHVELVGNVYDESCDHARKIAEEHDSLFIHAFNNEPVIVGQGTLALEMMENPAFKEIEAVICSVGGGGLITGCATAIKAKYPHIKIYGVGALNAPAARMSYEKKQIIESPVQFTIAEGVATKRPSPEMLFHLDALLDGFFSLSEESIAHGISIMAEQGKLVVEGAGALPIAALLEEKIPEKKVALILSGGNIDLTTLSSVLQRGLLVQGRLVRFIITVPDRPGGLLSITQLLAQHKANVLEVHHQRATLDARFGETAIEVDLETRSKEHSEEVAQALADKGFQVERVR